MKMGSNSLSKMQDFSERMRKYKALLIMLIPGIVYFVIFHYIPMYGVTLAFKDLNLIKGILGSPWVGFKHLEQMFSSPKFFQVLRNTLVISFLKLFFGFFPPLIFAILLTEIRNGMFKRVTQTISYLPHFISWIVLAGIIKDLVSLNGPVNYLWELLGNERVIFLSNSGLFRPLLVSTEIWKSFGWGSIIYLATISALDPTMYEAARIDGANRFQMAMKITLPSLVPVMTVLLILSMSGILSAGFDQIFNLYNPSVLDVSDIIDTYVYRMGIQNRDYSLATAAGLFKSVVSLIMIVVTNKVAKTINDEGYTLW